MITLPLQFAIDLAAEAMEAEEPRRGYIGASVVAQECERALWYDFRWATDKEWSGRMLRRFETGHKMEERIIRWLEETGAEVHHTNPKAKNDKKQYRADMFGGLLSGGIDGFLRSDLDWMFKPGVWHLVEVKAMASAKYAYDPNAGEYEIPSENKHPIKHPTEAGNESNIEGRWWKCRRQGVKKFSKEHYGQMQAYMGLSREIRKGSALKCKECKDGWVEDTGPRVMCQACSGNGKLPDRRWHECWGIDTPLDYALYIAVNTDTEQIHAEIVEFEPKWWAAIKRRALKVARATEPPERKRETPMFPPCRFCDHRRTCHLGEPMAVNCRTCEHAEVKLPGDRGYYGRRLQWMCKLHKRTIDAQATSCDQHSPIIPGIDF